MDSKEDDEIYIDFSKIKNFFKGDSKSGTKAEHEHKNEDKKNDDVEMSFDFGKIRKLFKPDEERSPGKEEEFNINWSNIIEFFKKYGVVFIALIPIILSIYVRVQTGSLHFTDSWAINSVVGGIKNQIKEGIDQQYPNLPDANKNALVETELQKFTSKNKAQIDQQIQATSNYIKSFYQDEQGKNYMTDIDPYYWYRYVKNIFDHGYPGDILKDGKPFDNHQLAPLGRFVQSDLFHVYFLYYFYKFLHFFAPDLTIMRSMFYQPVFMTAVCVLITLLIARRISGDIGGFFAGLMMAVNAAFLGRTLSPDNDAWVVFFPVIITWLFLQIIDAKSTSKVVTLTVIAGFFTGLFPFAWSGWWFIFDFLMATIAITFLYLVIVNFDDIRKNIGVIYSSNSIRNILVISIVYFLSTTVFVILISGWPVFRNSFLGPFIFPSIKAPVQSVSIWPNVLTTVAELNEGSIGAIMNSVGGQFLFFISLVGLILSVSREHGFKRFDFFYVSCSIIWYAILFFVFKNFNIPIFGVTVWILLPIAIWIILSILKRDSSYDFKLSILLSLWVVSTIFASIKGIRFTLLLAPAFSVAFGVALGKTFFYLSKWLTKELKIHKAVGSCILIILLLLVYVNPVRSAYNAAGSNLPLINDAWYNALAAIKQDSKPNAIITSWWDFGHHFKALADRPVTFDGTTQTDTAAHWVGKLFMTDNEMQAVGILRMLDCAHNSAFNTINKINSDAHKSKKIVDEIILLSREEATKRLIRYGLTDKQADEILSYTHCANPPEAYVIASEDMIGKSGVWAHFGSWNFERADIWENARKNLEEEAVGYMIKKFNYTRERGENTYFEMQAITSDSEANAWIAPWPGLGGTTTCSKNKNEIYVCGGNGLQINMSNYDIFGFGQQGIVRPKVVAFATESGLFKKQFNEGNLDIGITVIPRNENELQIILSSKELAGSMFIRMFYMQGHGLRFFKQFNHQRGLTGTDIYTYKVDWEGKNATIVQNFVKKQVPEINITKNADLTSKNNDINTANTTNSS